MYDVTSTQRASKISDGSGAVELARPFFERDNGATAKMIPGTIFRISLPENGGSSGYTWQPKESGSSPLLKLLRSDYVGGSNQPGSGGSRVFTYQVSPNLPADMVRGKLTLVNKRSWESVPSATFTLNIAPALDR